MPMLRQRRALERLSAAIQGALHARVPQVQEATYPGCRPGNALGSRFFSQSAGHQVWNRSIHIPDMPAWALVASGLGAGGLYYYYKYHIKPARAHAPAVIGPLPSRGQSASGDLLPKRAAVEPAAVPLPLFQATDVAKGISVTPDDLAGDYILLVFVDPTAPAAARESLTRLQDVTCQAGKDSSRRLQPIALDKTSGAQPGGRALAKLLEDVRKDAGKSEAGVPPIQGLAGEDALRKIRESVQRFAEDPGAKEAAVEPEAVTEEGVLHLFGPDGLLVVQYDATLIPEDVAKSIIDEMQRSAHLKRAAASSE